MDSAWNRLAVQLKDWFFPCEKTLRDLVTNHDWSLEQNAQAVCRLGALCQPSVSLKPAKRKAGRR